MIVRHLENILSPARTTVLLGFRSSLSPFELPPAAVWASGMLGTRGCSVPGGSPSSSCVTVEPSGDAPDAACETHRCLAATGKAESLSGLAACPNRCTTLPSEKLFGAGAFFDGENFFMAVGYSKGASDLVCGRRQTRTAYSQKFTLQAEAFMPAIIRPHWSCGSGEAKLPLTKLNKLSSLSPGSPALSFPRASDPCGVPRSDCRRTS